jgi:hypothetical protein
MLEQQQRVTDGSGAALVDEPLLQRQRRGVLHTAETADGEGPLARRPARPV